MFMSEASHIIRVVDAVPSVILPSRTVAFAVTLLQPRLPLTGAVFCRR